MEIELNVEVVDEKNPDGNDSSKTVNPSIYKMRVHRTLWDGN